MPARRHKAILREDPLLPLGPMWGTFRHIIKAQYVEDYFVKRSFFARPIREAAPIGLPGDVIWLDVQFRWNHRVSYIPLPIVHSRCMSVLWFGYSVVTVLIFPCRATLSADDLGRPGLVWRCSGIWFRAR